VRASELSTRAEVAAGCDALRRGQWQCGPAVCDGTAAAARCVWLCRWRHTTASEFKQQTTAPPTSLLLLLRHCSLCAASRCAAIGSCRPDPITRLQGTLHSMDPSIRSWNWRLIRLHRYEDRFVERENRPNANHFAVVSARRSAPQQRHLVAHQSASLCLVSGANAQHPHAAPPTLPDCCAAPTTATSRSGRRLIRTARLHQQSVATTVLSAARHSVTMPTPPSSQHTHTRRG